MKRQRLILIAILIVSSFATAATLNAAPRADPNLAARLQTAKPADLFGVILTFNGDRVEDTHLAQIRALGITGGYRMNKLPIIAVNANPAQITQLAGLASLRSIYLNVPVELYLNQSKPLIGVNRLRSDADITRRNRGLPISGKGVTVAINDTGVDGTHQDLTYNTLNPAAGKTIQNVFVSMSDKDGLLVRSATLGNVFEGIIPVVYLENQANTDSHGGHGTHVASTAAGTGAASGGLYSGVAPGANIVGLGSGVGLFVIGQIAAFDYCLSNQFVYNIRAINNSWGNSANNLDPNHPVNVASKALHDNNIIVVFANGNDGPDPNSQNRWTWSWTMNVGAARKDGRLAGFSSRGIFGHDTIHPDFLTPGTGVPDDDDPLTQETLTSDIVAARSRFNPAANGLNNDEQIPAAFLPNYTQISGTSMAAPHLTGVVANILEANSSLSPDQVKSVISRTATPLATYDEFEAGAGMANVHAAVDLALNPGKAYGNFGFNGKGIPLTRTDGAGISGTVAPASSNTHAMTVPANSRFTFVELNWGSIGEGEVVVDNTNLVVNDLSLAIQRNGQTIASSSDINLGGLFGTREGIKLELPADGDYTIVVSDSLAGAGIVADQPYTINIKHYLYDPNQLGDLGGLDAETQKQAVRLVYDQVMAANGGAFRPTDALTRNELGRALMLGARVPQYIPNTGGFSDLAVGTPESLFAESLRKEGVMGVTGSTFGGNTQVNRLESAVALVRALRLDSQAKALAGTTVTSGGQPLVDNLQIPSALRGYVQLAIDRGLLAAYPAEVREIAPNQFVALPGPRFEPTRVVTRGEAIAPITKLMSLMFGE
ncbi:MAG TPA: S8 family serine peptidase [Pyrinomonadaceae bacterium]|nr:S8 family serine peptidase [Pyrinomonadaceae bacterium]